MKPSNEINDMRQVLFNQLNRLTDPDCNVDKEIQRSKAIVEVCNVLVNSAKTEVDFMRVTGSKGSGFIPTSKQLGDGSGSK